MLSLAPSLRLAPALRCPICGQLLIQSVREDECMYCPECGYTSISQAHHDLNEKK